MENDSEASDQASDDMRPSAMGLRERLGISDDYVRYCREERNFAAVLYHLLLDEKRLGAFLELIGLSAVQARNAAVYFEYAHLRDLWAEVGVRHGTAESNARYRDAIIAMLAHPDVALPTDCKAFNEVFIGAGSKAASASFIQMPARWSDTQFQAWHARGGESFAQRACTLKWAFNAKPDLVLHLADGSVVCIEAKLGSGIGGYKAKTGLSSGPFGMSQTRLQEFIFNDLLRVPTRFVIVSKDGKRDTDAPWRRHTWPEVFAVLRREPCGSRMVAEFCERFLQPA